MSTRIAIAAVVGLAAVPAWAGEPRPVDVVVVVENTQGAAAADPDGYRWRAVGHLGHLLSDSDRMGVVQFDHGARVVRALAPPAPEHSAFEPGTAGTGDPAPALSLGLDLLASEPRDGARRELVLVSSTWPDGRSVALDAVVSRAQDARVRLSAYVTAEVAEVRLRAPVVASGGGFARLDRPSTAVLALQRWFDDVRPGGGVELADGRLPVDPSVTEARFVARVDEPGRVRLVDPTGRRLRGGNSGRHIHWYLGEDAVLVTIDGPVAGTWALEGAGDHAVSAYVESPLRLVAAVPSGGVEAGRPMFVTAHLADGHGPLREVPAGLSVSATLDGGEHVSADVLRDDGARGDRAAGDGVFWGAVVAPPAAGRHRVLFQATGPGFFRRSTVGVDVTPAPPPPARAQARIEVPVEPTGQTARRVLLLGTVAVALLLATMALGLNRRTNRRTQTAAILHQAELYGGQDPNPDLAQPEIDRLVVGYAQSLGYAFGPLSSSGSQGRARLLVFDPEGDLLVALARAAGDLLDVVPVASAAEAAVGLRVGQPAALVLVEPLQDATAREILRWSHDGRDRPVLPVLRVVDGIARDRLVEELAAGAIDVVLAAVPVEDLLRRVARALAAYAALVPPAVEAPAEAPRTTTELPEVGWLMERVRDWPVRLRIVNGNPDRPSTGMLVDVSMEGFKVVVPEASSEGSKYGFESELFASLALEKVEGGIRRCRGIASNDFPYLWEVRYAELDGIHRKRILSCYRGLLGG